MLKIFRGTPVSEIDRPKIPNTKRTPSTVTSTEHIDQHLYSLTDEFLGAIKKGRYKIHIAPSDIVDFGGQRSFDLTHQLFIRQKGSFLVMFDGRYGFSVPLPEYPGLNMTNEEIVKHWVNSILTYSVDEDDLMPMILFAATHSDHFTKEEINVKKVEFLNTLRDYFGNHPMRNHIVLDTLYFIDSRQPGDEEIERLKNRLVQIAISQPSWGERKPVRWVPLEVQIEAIKKYCRYIVQKEELIRVNALNGDLALSKNQLEQFLEYQHSTGKLIYIKHAGLSEFVVLYPPAAVNILRSFITDKMFWPEGQIACVLEQIYNSGMASKHLLKAIWDQEWVPINSAEEREFVIRLLVYLDVLIIPTQHRFSDVSKPETEEVFLIPCIIKDKLPMDFLEESNFSERSIALVFTMKRACIPPSLSYKLIGAVSSIWSLKEVDKKTLLFQFAAVFDIDVENEMRIFVQDNIIITYLTNKKSKHRISPDMAASIQECLVNTLDYTLSFYFGSMKSGKSSFNVKNLYDMKIGEVCNKKSCVIPIDVANATTEWTCSHGNTHQSAVPLKWVFDRSLLTCPRECKGLETKHLDETLDDRYSIRLAENLGIRPFKEMMIHLGVTKDELDELEYQYGGTLIVFKFMSLKRWRDCKVGTDHDPCLKDIQKALSDMGDNRHYLCRITKNMSKLDRKSSRKLTDVPEDGVLKRLARNMGNCVVHLGIELGIDVPAIEETLYRFPKDMFEQTYDIVRKWKQGCRVKPTIFRLMEAVDRVDKGGLRFLLDHYKI